MCNEEQLTRWAREGMNRRQFGAVAGAATLAAACTPMAGDANSAAGGVADLVDSAVAFDTADGTMDGWLVAPRGRLSPGVILWPDIAGLRAAKKTMASRLAGEGYAVLVVNPYYRDEPAPIWQDFADFAGNGGWPKARDMRAKLNADAIMRDAKAAVAFLDSRPEVDTARGIGTQGYCMGGPFAMWTAAAVPSRVKAAASFHGGGLVKDDDPKSPHMLMDQMTADLLIAIAQDDDAKSPKDKDFLRFAAGEAQRRATVEVFPGDHGWTVIDSPAYAEAAAEAAWAKLLALYKGAL